MDSVLAALAGVAASIAARAPLSATLTHLLACLHLSWEQSYGGAVLTASLLPVHSRSRPLPRGSPCWLQILPHLQLGDGVQVHFIRAVGQAQGAGLGVGGSEEGVLADTLGAM